MAGQTQWWVIWANNQPVAGVGVTATTFAGTKAQADARAAKVVDGTVTGPYATEAAALAAIKAAGGSGSGSTVTSPPAGPQQPSVPNPLAGLEGLAKIFGDFFTGLTDGKMWRSLGWIVLGIALMLAGVLWWIGPSAARRSPAGIAAGAGRRLAT